MSTTVHSWEENESAWYNPYVSPKEYLADYHFLRVRDDVPEIPVNHSDVEHKND